MYSKWEREMREDRCRPDFKNPSFSSSLLDEIYRSIDGGDTEHGRELRFYKETMVKKQSKGNSCGNVKSVRSNNGGGVAVLDRACLIDKWMNQKVDQKLTSSTKQRRQSVPELVRRYNNIQHERDLDQDGVFFSSTSISSDSSSGTGFSSSDTDSIFGAKSRASSLATPKPKPVRTSVPARSEKKAESALFYEHREVHMFDDYHYNSGTDRTPQLEESMIKSKSRALKIYSNLKKVKQPISPGGKLATFINSLFTTGNTKKSKNSSSSVENFDEDRKFKSGQASTTCSSASSFSRSCLSKNSPTTRERLRSGAKRNVSFYPVSVIVDEDSRPIGHKSLYEGGEEEELEPRLMSVSLPTAWQIRTQASRKIVADEDHDQVKYKVIEKSRRVEDAARKFLKDYHHQNQKKNDATMIDAHDNYCTNYHYDQDNEDEDDAASCSSSDLFELDHLEEIGGNDRYMEELPVYETTHFRPNRAIAKGLLV